MTDHQLLQIRRAVLDDAAQISALILQLAPFFTLRSDGQGAEVFLERVNTKGVQGFLQSA